LKREKTLAIASNGFFVNPVWWYHHMRVSVESDIQNILKNKPDIVIADMHWSARAATHFLRIPYISILNASWTNYFSFRIKAFDDHILTRVLGRRLFGVLFPWLKKTAMSFWVYPYRALKRQKEYKGLETNNLLEFLEGDLTLLADIPEFCPTSGLPESMKYIGPLTWNPSQSVSFPKSHFDHSRPLVYVTMGSTGKEKFFRQGLEAFAGTEYQVVMTTAHFVSGNAVFPENFLVTDFAPGFPFMERASVVVCHGGIGTIYQALMSGIPLVGIPAHFEQQIQLQLCESAGVGLKIREKTCTGDTLFQAVEKVCHSSSYSEKAILMKKRIAQFNPPQMAAQYINEFLEVA
jgi:MGT family glycosyltransferase